MLGVSELLLLLLLLGVGVVFVVGLAVVAAVVVARRGVVRRDPLEVAAERYARGEIDRDQYQQIKCDLEDRGTPTVGTSQ